MTMFSRTRYALATSALLIAASAHAWGPDGHHTVGAIADRLLVGSNAETHVKVLLGSLTLQDAAVWADCAKGIDPAQGYVYTSAGRYPECRIFETPQEEGRMADLVRRNDTNCDRKPTEESCHRQYHYADVAIQRDRYATTLAGARDDDIVAAVTAAVDVLQGRPSPAPFNIVGEREALLLLTHYVGDIHQPLHVGAVYLDAAGGIVDPDTETFDAATDTRGGNQISTTVGGSKKHGSNLHATWDQIPATLNVDQVGTAWLVAAKAVPVTQGSPVDWSTAWGTETLRQARQALGGLPYGPEQAGVWPVGLTASYVDAMDAIKQRQLTTAGARLAQLLQTIWP